MEGTKLAICVFVSVGFAANLKAAASGPPRGPYQGIVDRNAFGLKSVPVVDPVPTTPATPKPKVILTGITTILGAPRALFKVQFPARPGQPANEQSYILTEGQKEGDLEVLRINDLDGTVEVNDFGSVITLDINKDSPKLPSTPAAPPQAAAIANPVTNAAPTNPAPTPAALVPPPVLPDAANAALKRIPTRVPRASALVQPPPPPLPQAQPQQLTPEEQALLLQLEQQATNGSVPPPPR